MKLLFPAALCLCLAACATPRDRVVTQEVKVAVPVPCEPKLSPRPALLTKEQVNAALARAQNLDDKIKIVTEQLLLYIGWVPVVEAGLQGCKG